MKKPHRMVLPSIRADLLLDIKSIPVFKIPPSSPLLSKLFNVGGERVTYLALAHDFNKLRLNPSLRPVQSNTTSNLVKAVAEVNF